MSVFLDYGGVNATTPSQEQDFIIGFTDEELQALTITTGVSAALSLIGSGMILGTYIGLPGTRSFAFQMVFMLSLCDFMSSLAFVFSLGWYFDLLSPCSSLQCQCGSVGTCGLALEGAWWLTCGDTVCGAWILVGVDYTSDVVEDRCYAAAYMNQFFGNGANFWTYVVSLWQWICSAAGWHALSCTPDLPCDLA